MIDNCFVLTLAHTCYFAILDSTWRGGGAPNSFSPNCNRASQQRRTECLGSSESNHSRFYYLMSHLDLCRGSSIKKCCFLARCSRKLRQNSFVCFSSTNHSIEMGETQNVASFLFFLDNTGIKCLHRVFPPRSCCASKCISSPQLLADLCDGRCDSWLACLAASQFPFRSYLYRNEESA